MLEAQSPLLPSRLLAFTLVGEGLAPAYGDGEVIVADLGEAPKPGGRAVLELVNGRVLFVRLLKVVKVTGEVSVEHLVSHERTAFRRQEVAHLSALRATFSRGQGPRGGILEWRELPTQGGLR